MLHVAVDESEKHTSLVCRVAASGKSRCVMWSIEKILEASASRSQVLQPLLGNTSPYRANYYSKIPKAKRLYMGERPYPDPAGIKNTPLAVLPLPREFLTPPNSPPTNERFGLFEGSNEIEKRCNPVVPTHEPQP